MKFKTWDKKDINHVIGLSIKIDGVRVHIKKGVPYSRANKILTGVPHGFKDGVYEIFKDDFDTTVGIVRSHNPEFKLTEEHLFSLKPVDPRLKLNHVDSYPSEVVEEMLTLALRNGHEGLIFTPAKALLGGHQIKVKPVETFDVPVIGMTEGKGQFVGALGAFITPMGKVGTGFTPEQRAEFFDDKYLGTIIEVSCMGLTKNNKFRHPRFERERFDKNE